MRTARATEEQAGHFAFLASAVGVALSVPAAIAFQKPDLPGLVLFMTGGLATLLTLRHWRERRFRILAALVALNGALLALHALFHRLGVSHDWQEPLYLGVLVAYCAVAFSLSLRQFRRG